MDNLGLFYLIFGTNNKNNILDQLMIFGAEYLIILAFILIFLIAFKGKTKERKALILALFSLPILVIIIKFIHLFFYEPRPYVTLDISPLIAHEENASFPSRHITIMSAIAFSYIYFKSKWSPLFLFFLLWVGISRVYVGVHYPLDIIGGIIVGIISVLLAKQIVQFLKIRFSLS